MNLSEPFLGLAVEDKGSAAAATAAAAKIGGEEAEGSEVIGQVGSAPKNKRRSKIFGVSGPSKVEAVPFPVRTSPSSRRGSAGSRASMTGETSGSGTSVRIVRLTDEDEDEKHHDVDQERKENILSNAGSDSFPGMTPATRGGAGGEGQEQAPTLMISPSESRSESSGREQAPQLVISPSASSEHVTTTAAARPPSVRTADPASTATLHHPLLSPVNEPRSTNEFGEELSVSLSVSHSAGSSSRNFARQGRVRAAVAADYAAATGAAAASVAIGATTGGEGGRGRAEERGGGGGGERGGSRSRLMSTRFSASVTAEMKPTEAFSQPLASEGDGGVFPAEVPEAKRRALEVSFIHKFDRLAINPNVGEFWMLIDAKWVARWCSFVLGQTGPPGPISNRRLVDDNRLPARVRRPDSPSNQLTRPPSTRSDDSMGTPGTPSKKVTALRSKRFKTTPGLQAVKDYRAIHPMVWFIFREMYDTDGGPDICRWKLDLYSTEVVLNRRARILEPAHTKAIYQLRRFVSRIKQDVEDEKEKAKKLERENLQKLAKGRE